MTTSGTSHAQKEIALLMRTRLNWSRVTEPYPGWVYRVHCGDRRARHLITDAQLLSVHDARAVIALIEGSINASLGVRNAD